MAKKTRIPIVIGQIALFVLGIFLIIVYFGVYQESLSMWYHGPAPGIFLILGLVFIIVAVMLFSVVQYEVKKR